MNRTITLLLALGALAAPSPAQVPTPTATPLPVPTLRVCGAAATGGRLYVARCGAPFVEVDQPPPLGEPIGAATLIETHQVPCCLTGIIATDASTGIVWVLSEEFGREIWTGIAPTPAGSNAEQSPGAASSGGGCALDPHGPRGAWALLLLIGALVAAPRQKPKTTKKGS